MNLAIKVDTAFFGAFEKVGDKGRHFCQFLGRYDRDKIQILIAGLFDQLSWAEREQEHRVRWDSCLQVEGDCGQSGQG